MTSKAKPARENSKGVLAQTAVQGVWHGCTGKDIGSREKHTKGFGMTGCFRSTDTGLARTRSCLGRNGTGVLSLDVQLHCSVPDAVCAYGSERAKQSQQEEKKHRAEPHHTGTRRQRVANRERYAYATSTDRPMKCVFLAVRDRTRYFQV